MEATERFDSALYGVCGRLRRVLSFLPAEVRQYTEEIRLRAGLPVALTVRGRPLFVLESGEVTGGPARGMLTADADDLIESFRLLCRDSVYAHAAEIRDGYLQMTGGHRAGICGTVTPDGMMRDITSINIRVAREVPGCADRLAAAFDGGGMLIAGPPGSGKTTVLRDLVRQLSDGVSGRCRRVVVIDSRGEISGGAADGNDLGRNTDVLFTRDRAAGMEMAVRTMFPDVVAFDEIGTAAELKSVSDSFNAGVSVIATAHAGERDDLLRRSVTRGLLASGAVSQVVLLPPRAFGEAQFFRASSFLPDVRG